MIVLSVILIIPVSLSLTHLLLLLPHRFLVLTQQTHHSHHTQLRYFFSSCGKPTYVTNLSDHGLSSGHMTESTAFMTGRFFRASRFLFCSFLHSSFCFFWFRAADSAGYPSAFVRTKIQLIVSYRIVCERNSFRRSGDAVEFSVEESELETTLWIAVLKIPALRGHDMSPVSYDRVFYVFNSASSLSGMGNECRPKCGDDLRPGSKGRMAHSTCG